jgi:hypothetical protein
MMLPSLEIYPIRDAGVILFLANGPVKLPAPGAATSTTRRESAEGRSPFAGVQGVSP